MAYLDNIKQGALQGWYSHQILPSITGSQAALESGWGTSALSKPPHNNNFGIKAPSGYTGSNVVTMPTREYLNGQWITVSAQFLTYPTLNDSIKDHAAFFTNTEWRRNNYRHVVGERDYKKAAWALQNAGYATDPGYANKLIRIIEQYNLVNWDKEALSGANNQNVVNIIPNTNSTVVATTTNSKTIGGVLTSAARQSLNKIGVTVIGDSLGVGTKSPMQQLFPNGNYDVVGSRQWTHIQANLNATVAYDTLRQAGTLKDVLVFILGTNRGVEADEIDNIVKTAGKRKILLVDTASEVNHRASVSSAYQSASVRHENVFYVNWSTQAIPLLSAYYYADGAGGKRIHMNPTGYQKHAEYIAMAVYEAVNGNFNEVTTTATDKEPDFMTIKNVELREDGTMLYEMMKPIGIVKPGQPVRAEKVTLTENIGIKGLYSPKGDPMIYNKAANDRWGFNSNGPQAQFIEGIYENDSTNFMPDLVKAAAKELIKHSEPAAQYKVKLSDIPFEVSIGDTGIFIDHEFNPPLYIKARVLEIATSETNPSAGYVTIGNVTELYPQDRSAVQRLRDEIKRSRAELLKEWREGGPIDLRIESLGSTLLTKNDKETTLIVRAFQGDIEVTDWFSKFKWTRLSNNQESDNSFNELLKVQQSGALTVYFDDLIGAGCTFACTVYDEADEIVGMTAIRIEKVIFGQSAYELAKDKGFVGTLDEWLISLKGQDGLNGLPGTKGEDGRTSYTHIAYANSADGTVDFSKNDSNGRRYIGMYTDFIIADSSDPSKYRWVDMLANVEIIGKNYYRNSTEVRTSTRFMSFPVYPYLTGEVGNQWTFSLEIKINEGGTERELRLYRYQSNGLSIDKSMTFNATKEWQRISITGEVVYDNRNASYSLGEMAIYDYAGENDYSVRNVKLEKGRNMTPFSIAEEDLLEKIETKADAVSTEQALNDAVARLQTIQQEIEAAATARELSDFIRRYNEEQTALANDKKESELNVSRALSSIDLITQNMGSMSETWNFVDRFIKNTPEGIMVGDNAQGSYILLKEDRLAFYSNGQEVAFIAQNLMQISRGAFVEEIQIGKYKFEESIPNHLTVRYVGG